MNALCTGKPDIVKPMMISHIGGSYFLGFYLSPTSFRLRLILKRCGFDLFYLALNPAAQRFESGYRIYKGGIRDRVEGCDYPLLEEFILKYPLSAAAN